MPAAIFFQSYLYFTIGSQGFSAYIQNIGRGVGVPHISGKEIGAFTFPLPPRAVQQKIADTLAAYDDLIANNRRRMALLEESARQLYREWFVRLRFPGREHTRISDGVPEGWEHVPFSQLADFINGFPFKPADQLATGLPILKIPELREGVVSG